MKNVFLFPYSLRSISVVNLAIALGCKIIIPEKSDFQADESKVIINYGSLHPKLLEYSKSGLRVINRTSVVERCMGKIGLLQTLKDRGVNTVPYFSNDSNSAFDEITQGNTLLGFKLDWEKNKTIHTLHSKSVEKRLPLKYDYYTQYVPKSEEYRVHVFAGNVIYAQVKRLRDKDNKGKAVDKESVNWRIRTTENGFKSIPIRIRDLPNDVIKQSELASRVIPNLTFGVLDVLYSKSKDQATVIGCNTHPYLFNKEEDPDLLNTYVDSFNGILKTPKDYI